MELGDPLFYETPQADADVPLAALRALARRRPAFEPQSDLKLTPQQHPQIHEPPPMIQDHRQPTMPQIEPEWKGIVDHYINDQQKDQRSEEDDILARIQEIMKGAQTPPFNPSASPKAAPADLDSYFAKNRAFESGGDRYAVNQGSGAAGLYQFLPSTWTSIMNEAPHLGLTPNGMHDEEQQNAAMRYYTAKSAATLRPILGRAPTGGELYALHLLGHSGGAHLVQNPNRPLTEVISKAAMDGNPWLYNYQTGQDLINQLNRRFS